MRKALQILDITYPNPRAFEVKEAYLKQARRLHPDKNRDDPLAKEKFQQLAPARDFLAPSLKQVPQTGA